MASPAGQAAFNDITSDEACQFCVDSAYDAQNQMAQLLTTMIQNKCVNTGDGKCEEIRNIQVLENFFEARGIRTTIHHPSGKPNRPSLTASYGSGSPRVMLGPGHVDVVPVPPDNAEAVEPTYSKWEHGPFSGLVKDGYVHGRGAVDMLGTVVAQAVCFALMVQRGVPLRGTLLFCAVSDEEAGGKDGVQFLLSDPQLKGVFAADYCMTELGGCTLPDRAGNGTKRYAQANAEKGVAHCTIEVRGKAGHGSLPRNGDNALVRASEVVSRLAKYNTPTVVTPEWCSLVDNLDISPLVRAPLKNAALLPWVIDLLLKTKNPLGPLAHANSCMTISPNAVEPQGKLNVVPGKCTVHVDVRTLPGQEQEYILEQLRSAVGADLWRDEEHYSIAVRTFQKATRSDTDTPLWAAMSKAAEAVVPGATICSIMLPGGTDNRFYRETGTVAYGANLLEPSVTFKSLMSMFHGDNEKISERSLWTSLQFYVLTVKHMMGADSPL